MAEIEVGRVTIRVEPDTRGFKRDLEREVGAAAKGAEKNVNMGADFDGSNVKPEAAAVAKDAKQKVKFEADADGFQRVQLMARETLRIQNRTGNLSRIAQNAHLIRQQKEAAGLAQTLNAIRAKDPRLATVGKLRVFQRETFALQKRTAALRAKSIKVRQKGNAANLAAALVIRKVASGTSKLEFPNFGSGINGSAFALIAGLVTLFASPVLGFLTTALLALPGLIGLVAAPIGALALGMDGLKYAAKQLENPLNDLKLAMSAQAADTFTPIFARLIPAMQAITQPLAGVTQGLGGFADGILNAVVQGDGLERIQDSLFNIGNFFDSSDDGAERFTAGFTTLAHAFSDQLPDLSDWFNEQGTAFDEWIGEITANGQLEGAFDNLGTVLDTIIDQFTRLLGIAFDGFSGENGADLLVDSFELLGDALANVLEFSNLIIAAWDKLRQGTKFITAATKLITGDPFGAIRDLEQGLGVRPLDEVTVDTEKATAKLSMFEGHVAAVSQNVNGNLTKIQGPGLGNNSNPALDAFLGTGGGPLGGPGAKGPVAPVIDTAERDKKIAEHAQFIQTTADQVSGALSKDFGGGTLPTPDFSAYQAAWQGLVTVVDTATTQLADAPSKLLTISGQVTSAFSGVGPAAVTAFGEMVGAVRSGVDEAVGIIEGLPPRMSGPIEALAGTMYTQGLAIGNGLARGIEDSTAAAVTAAQNMANQVAVASAATNEIKSPSRRFARQGEDIVNGLSLGIDGQAYLAQLAIQNAVAPNSQTSAQIAKAYKDLVPDLGKAGIKPGDTEAQLAALGFSQDQVQRLKEVSTQYKDINRQLKFLKADLAASNDAGDVAIQQEIDRLKEIKKRLKVEKDALGLAKDAAGVKGDAQEDEIKASDYLNKSIGAGTDFAMANANQFASDLGISGSGALSQGLDQGISFLSSSLSKMISGGFAGSGGNIVVNNVDDAVAAKQNQTNIQKKRYVNR